MFDLISTKNLYLIEVAQVYGSSIFLDARGNKKIRYNVGERRYTLGKKHHYLGWVFTDVFTKTEYESYKFSNINNLSYVITAKPIITPRKFITTEEAFSIIESKDPTFLMKEPTEPAKILKLFK